MWHCWFQFRPKHNILDTLKNKPGIFSYFNKNNVWFIEFVSSQFYAILHSSEDQFQVYDQPTFFVGGCVFSIICLIKNALRSDNLLKNIVSEIVPERMVWVGEPPTVIGFGQRSPPITESVPRTQSSSSFQEKPSNDQALRAREPKLGCDRCQCV